MQVPWEDRQAVLEAALAARQAELALPDEDEGLVPRSDPQPEPEPQLGSGLVLELKADAVDLFMDMPSAGDGIETPESEYGTPLTSFQRGSQIGLGVKVRSSSGAQGMVLGRCEDGHEPANFNPSAQEECYVYGAGQVTSIYGMPSERRKSVTFGGWHQAPGDLGCV